MVFIDYTTKQLRRIVEAYQELRSAVEITASMIDGGKPKGIPSGKSFEHIICILVDVDRAIVILTPRQKAVIGLVKQGYSGELIGRKLGLSLSTIKFHFHQAILRMTTYLNYG